MSRQRLLRRLGAFVADGFPFLATSKERILAFNSKWLVLLSYGVSANALAGTIALKQTIVY